MEHGWSSSSGALHVLRLLLTPLSTKFIYPVFFFFTLANEKECHGCSETNKQKKVVEVRLSIIHPLEPPSR